LKAICIGPADARRSYLSASAIISAAVVTGCDAIHPGYGFLSEDAGFAEAVAAHGVTFVGPSAEVLSLSTRAICYLMSWTPNWFVVLGVTDPRLMAPGLVRATTHQPLMQPLEPLPLTNGLPGSWLHCLRSLPLM
jgi:hypothetical protein